MVEQAPPTTKQGTHSVTNTSAPTLTTTPQWVTTKHLAVGALYLGRNAKAAGQAQRIVFLDRTRTGVTFRLANGVAHDVGTATKMWLAMPKTALPKAEAAASASLNGMTLTQLRKLARAMGVTVPAKADRAKLLAALQPEAASVSIKALRDEARSAGMKGSRNASRAECEAFLAAEAAPPAAGTPRDGSSHPAKFLISAYPNQYTCRTCDRALPATNFPKVPAGIGVERTYRQTQCRDCRAVVNGHAEWNEV